MAASEDLRGGEVSEVLVVRDDVDRSCGPFEVVSPRLECFKDGQEFLVVRIVVQLRAGQGSGVEHDRVEFAGVEGDGQDTGDGVVRSVGLDGDLVVRHPVVADRGGDERGLERVERVAALLVEVPRYSFAGEAGERKDDLGVVVDEPPIEVREPEERLDVADFSGFGPVEDSLDFLLGHGETVSGEDVAEILDGLRVEFALVCAGVEVVLAESSEDFLDMFLVVHGVVGVDEDVVEVDNNADVEEVGEDVVDKLLESCGGVRNSKRHDLPLK